MSKIAFSKSNSDVKVKVANREERAVKLYRKRFVASVDTLQEYCSTENCELSLRFPTADI